MLHVYPVVTDQEDDLTSVPMLVPIMEGLTSMALTISFEDDPTSAVIHRRRVEL